MAKGWVTVNIRQDIRQKLEQKYLQDPKRPRSQRFNAWFDNLLFDLVEHYEMMKKHGTFLAVESIGDTHILLMDNLIGRHIVIQISEKDERPMLFCEEDSSAECLHVGFCLALPEVYKTLVGKGFTPSSGGEAKLLHDKKEWQKIREDIMTINLLVSDRDGHYELVPDLFSKLEDETKLISIMGDDKYKEFIKEKEMDSKCDIKPTDEAKLISIMGHDKYKEFIKGLTKNLVEHKARVGWLSKEDARGMASLKDRRALRMQLNTLTRYHT